MAQEIKVKLKEAYDTEANWISKNPVLLAGQLAYSSDKYGKYKIGDGIKKWSELQYVACDAVSIIQDVSHRFVTDEEKTKWNSKTTVSIVRWS